MINVEVCIDKNDGNLSENLTSFLVNPVDSLSEKDTENVTHIDLLLPTQENLKVNARYHDKFKMFVFYSVIVDEKLLLGLHSFYLNPVEILLSSVTVKTPKDLYITFMFKIEE